MLARVQGINYGDRQNRHSTPKVKETPPPGPGYRLDPPPRVEFPLTVSILKKSLPMKTDYWGYCWGRGAPTAGQTAADGAPAEAARGGLQGGVGAVAAVAAGLARGERGRGRPPGSLIWRSWEIPNLEIREIPNWIRESASRKRERPGAVLPGKPVTPRAQTLPTREICASSPDARRSGMQHTLEGNHLRLADR